MPLKAAFCLSVLVLLFAGCAPKEITNSYVCPAKQLLKPSFAPNLTQETLSIESDRVFEGESVPNLAIVKEGVTLRFAAPLGDKLFAPAQKIGAINVSANGVTLIFAAGDYQAESILVHAKTNGAFTLKTEGTVRLFVANNANFQIEKPKSGRVSALINADYKAQNLQLIIGGNLKVNAPAGYKINALVYVGGKAEIDGDKESEFSGAFKVLGDINLKDSSGKYTLDQNAIDALYHNGDSNEWCLAKPEMPSISERNKTLLGIDENRNGIRDDAELAIIEKYRDDPLIMALSMQDAAYDQQILQVYEDKEKSIELAKMNTSNDCHAFVWWEIIRELNPLKDNGEASLSYRKEMAQMNWLDDRVFNTEDRLKAYWKYNSQLNGESFKHRDEMKSDCKFDIDAIVEGAKQ